MSREEALQNLKSSLAPFAGPFGDISINGVDIQGRLSAPLMEAHIQPLLDANNLDDLVQSFARVQTTLLGLSVFQDVTMSITPEKVVTIILTPMKKYTMGIGSNFSQQEGSGYIRGSLCNKTGWGEQISLDVSTGTRTKSSHMLRALLPIPWSKMADWKSEFLAYSSEKDNDWANNRSAIRGLSFRLNKDNGTSVGLDAVLRDVRAQKLLNNDLMKNFAGESFKFSFFYNVTYDNRVFDELFPMGGRGTAGDLRSEIALHPSTTPFIKFSSGYRSAWKIWRKITGSLNFKAGIIMPLKRGAQTHVSDRFNLGGPLDVRAFRFNHLGPHDSQGTATGGEVLLATGLSVFSPVSKDHPNLKFHKFLNVGYLGSLQSTTLKDILNPSIAAGLGLCYASPQARFELNIGMPLVARSGEWFQKGLQFGVGLEFL